MCWKSCVTTFFINWGAKQKHFSHKQEEVQSKSQSQSKFTFMYWRLGTKVKIKIHLSNQTFPNLRRRSSTAIPTMTRFDGRKCESLKPEVGTDSRLNVSMKQLHHSSEIGNRLKGIGFDRACKSTSAGGWGGDWIACNAFCPSLFIFTAPPPTLWMHSR